MALAPHQERVVAEKRDLDEKIEKLNAFVTSAAITQVSLAEARRLRDQLAYMRSYSAVLQERINAFEAG